MIANDLTLCRTLGCEEPRVALTGTEWVHSPYNTKDFSLAEATLAFHTSVARCSGNKVVEQLIPIIDTAVMMFVNVTHQRLTKETVMTHRAIVDAISDRDPIGAKTAMMMHMTYNRNMILKLIREEKEKNHKE